MEVVILVLTVLSDTLSSADAQEEIDLVDGDPQARRDLLR